MNKDILYPSLSLSIRSIFIAALALIVGVFVFSGTTLAAHTATVTVDKPFVKYSTPNTYTFSVLNNGPDSIAYIKINAPLEFTINDSLVCPSGWLIWEQTASTVKCQSDSESGNELLSGSTAQVSFLAVSAPNSGDYSWAVKTATAVINNVNTTVDATPPTTTDSGIDALWHQGSVQVTLNASDGSGSGVALTQYKVDNGEWNTYAGSPFTISADGEHTISYRSTDSVGNVEETKTALNTVKIDNTAPVTDILLSDPKHGSGPVYVKSTTTFSLSTVEVASGVALTEYKIDSADWTAYLVPFSATGAGSHIVSYRSKDAVNNQESDKTLTVFVDDTPPVVSTITITPFYAGTDRNYVSGSSNISAPVNDGDGSGIALCEYTLNGTDWLSASYENNNCSVSGANTSSASSINIRATDYVGNSVAGTAVAVVPDITAPLTVDRETDTFWHNVDTTITLDVRDDPLGSGVASTKYCIDSNNTCTPSVDYTTGITVSTEGINNIRYQSIDRVGNTQAVQTSANTVRIDKTLPTVDAGADKITNAEFTQTGTASDNGSGINTYLWENMSPEVGNLTFGSAGAVSTTISASASGIYTVKFTVTDVAGNSNSDTMQLTWDTIRPTVVLTQNHTDLIVRDADTVVITATFNEAMASVPTITINPVLLATTMTATADPKVWTFSWEVPADNNGTATATVAGSDLAGNAYNEGTNLAFVIDNTAPEVAITAPSANQFIHSHAGQITLTPTATDANLDICKYSIDGSEQTIDCAGGSISGISDGKKTLTLTAYDVAGNSASASVNFVMDTDGILTVDDTVANNADFITIQAAIDAATAGDTINVAAGTYNERVVINKSLTLHGATYNIDKNGYAVPTNYAWDTNVESIINHPNPTAAYDSVVDIVDVDNVTLEGFVIQELNAVGNLNSSLVRVYAHTRAISNIIVRNNIIGPNTKLVGQDGTNGRMGLYIINHPYSGQYGVVDSTFSGNKIFDTKGNGNNVFIWSSYHAYGALSSASMSGTVIEDNEIYGSHRSGIETAGGYSGLTIRDNKIYNNNVLPGDNPNKLMYGNGIVLVRGSGDRTIDGYGPEDLTIVDNEIYNNQKNGIYMDPINHDYTITGNNIHNNGWDGIMLDLGGQYANPLFDLTLPPFPSYGGSENIAVNFNKIENNGQYGVRVNGTPTNGFRLDATENWWGTAAKSTIQSKISSNVDFEPYYVNAAMNTLSDVSISTVNVDDDFVDGNAGGGIYGYDAFAKIQEGVDKVSSGGTVNVAPGTYTEQVTITKSLNLIGAGEASTTIVAPAVRTGSVTQGTTIHDYLLAAYATSSTIDVRVEGFTIDVNSKNKTSGTAQMDGVFFRDVKDAGGTMAGLFASTIHNFAATPDYEGFGVVVYGDSLLTLNDNDISDYTRDGISINRYGGSGSNPNVTISNNTITGSATPLNGINISTVTAGSVTGNTVTGNTRSLPWAGGGIVVWASTGMTISGNHVDGNFYGIDLQPIETERTHHVTISGNELTDNIKRGISLSGADNNTVKSNTISGPVGGTDDVAIGLANTSTGNTIGGSNPTDGNTITMATSSTGGGLLYAIYMQFDVGTGSNTIKYNTITGGQRAVQFDGAPGITGLTTVANNTITGQVFGAILASNNGSLIITDNTLTNTVRPMEFYGPHDLTITGNTINGSTYTGINLGSFSGTANVSSNTIHGIADDNGIWAQTSGTGLTISSNTIYDISSTVSGNGLGGGIQIDATADGADIDGNEIYNVTGFAGIVINTDATGVKINNNHIHNNELGVAANEQTAEFENNRILNNHWGVDLTKTGAAFVLLNNNISGNNTNLADSYGVALYAGAANVVKNYWGAITGPTSNDNIGGTGDKIVGTMDFAPWCTNSTCSPVDETPPASTFVSGLPASLTKQTSASITLDGTDVLYYKSKLDSGSYGAASAVSALISLNGLAAGSHTLSVIGRDQAGNWQSQSNPTTYTWTIDTSSPSLSTVSIASNNSVPTLAKVGDRVTVSFTANENIQSPVVTIAGHTATVTAGADAQHWAAAYTMAESDAEGTITFAISFADLAGNDGTPVTTATDGSSVTFDKTPPTINITAPSAGAKVSTNTVISFTITNGTNPECSVDNTNWTACTSSTTAFSGIAEFSGLPQGVFTLYLKDMDVAGNIGNANVSLVKDTIAPTVESKTPDANTVGVDPTGSIAITFSEPVTVTTNDVSLTTGSSTVSVTISGSGTANINIVPGSVLLNNSTYTVTIKTTTADLAGNALAQQKVWSFTTAGSYSFTLTNGWNLVSLGVAPNNDAISTVLGTASSNIRSVWAYDANQAEGQQWSVYHPNSSDGTSNLSSMKAGKGYWVDYTGTSSATLSGPGNLFLAGNNVPPSQTLKAGWNLIGYYQREAYVNAPVGNALKTLKNTDTGNPWWTMLVKYDNSAKQFGQVGNTENVSSGQGYWILMGGRALDTYVYAPGIVE